MRCQCHWESWQSEQRLWLCRKIRGGSWERKESEVRLETGCFPSNQINFAIMISGFFSCTMKQISNPPSIILHHSLFFPCSNPSARKSAQCESLTSSVIVMYTYSCWNHILNACNLSWINQQHWIIPVISSWRKWIKRTGEKYWVCNCEGSVQFLQEMFPSSGSYITFSYM